MAEVLQVTAPGELTTQLCYDRNEDGSWWFKGVSGWEDYLITGRYEVVNGKCGLTAVAVEPLDGAEPIILTSSKIRTLPLAELAKFVFIKLNSQPSVPLSSEQAETVRTLVGQGTVPGERITVEEVARVWQAAHEAGDPAPRAAVVKHFYTSKRTADRFIDRARRRGLIPPAAGQKRPYVPAGEPGGQRHWDGTHWTADPQPDE